MIHNVIPWLKSSPLEGCISNWTQDDIPGFYRAFGGMTGPKYLSCPCWSYILKKRWKIKGNFFELFCLVSKGRFGWCTWWIQVICINKGGWYLLYMYILCVHLELCILGMVWCIFSIMHTRRIFLYIENYTCYSMFPKAPVAKTGKVDWNNLCVGWFLRPRSGTWLSGQIMPGTGDITLKV